MRPNGARKRSEAETVAIAVAGGGGEAPAAGIICEHGSFSADDPCPHADCVDAAVAAQAQGHVARELVAEGRMVVAQ